MYGTHAELAAIGVDTNALLGLLQEGEEGEGEEDNGVYCEWLHEEFGICLIFLPPMLL